MSEKRKQEVHRIKELESINLAREEIRDLVIETKKEVERDNDLLADQISDELNKRGIKSIDVVGAIGAGNMFQVSQSLGAVKGEIAVS